MNPGQKLNGKSIRRTIFEQSPTMKSSASYAECLPIYEGLSLFSN